MPATTATTKTSTTTSSTTNKKKQVGLLKRLRQKFAGKGTAAVPKKKTASTVKTASKGPEQRPKAQTTNTYSEEMPTDVSTGTKETTATGTATPVTTTTTKKTATNTTAATAPTQPVQAVDPAPSTQDRVLATDPAPTKTTPSFWKSETAVVTGQVVATAVLVVGVAMFFKTHRAALPW